MRFEGRLPVDAYETVIDGATERLDPYHRLIRARQNVVDADQLREWDRHVPLASGEHPEVPFEAAIDYLLSALELPGDPYVNRLESLLTQRRIDVRQTANKR